MKSFKGYKITKSVFDWLEHVKSLGAYAVWFALDPETGKQITFYNQKEYDDYPKLLNILGFEYIRAVRIPASYKTHLPFDEGVLFLFKLKDKNLLNEGTVLPKDLAEVFDYPLAENEFLVAKIVF